MKKTDLLMLLVLGLNCTGCKKDKTTEALRGTYKGKLVITNYAPKSISETDVELTLNSKNYSSTKGSGTFQLLEENVLDFKDINNWLANFDWKTILMGKYKYEKKGDSLILIKIFNPPGDRESLVPWPVYRYRLALVK